MTTVAVVPAGPAPPPDDPVLTAREAAGLLKISVPAVHAWCADGTIPADKVVRIGRAGGVRKRLRIRRSAVEAILNPPAKGVA